MGQTMLCSRMFRSSVNLLAAAALLAFGGNAARASSVENPLYGYSHLLPSPFTLSAGKLVLGTEMAFGLTDFLQVGTNVLSDFYKVYNANAKISLVDRYEFALALTGAWQSHNFRDISAAYPDLRVTSVMPGAVAAFALHPKVAAFVGGNLNFTSTDFVLIGDSETSGYVRGASIGSDISFAYNPAKKGRVGNVLSAGVSYDFTYKLAGFGVSHHWPGFHFGIHYYPGATQYPVYPILSGGMAVEL